MLKQADYIERYAYDVNINSFEIGIEQYGRRANMKTGIFGLLSMPFLLLSNSFILGMVIYMLFFSRALLVVNKQRKLNNMLICRREKLKKIFKWPPRTIFTTFDYLWGNKMFLIANVVLAVYLGVNR